jgi:hypothetical protein
VFGVSIWKNKLIGVKTEQKRRKEAKETNFSTPRAARSILRAAQSEKSASKDTESYARTTRKRKKRTAWHAR